MLILFKTIFFDPTLKKMTNLSQDKKSFSAEIQTRYSLNVKPDLVLSSPPPATGYENPPKGEWSSCRSLQEGDFSKRCMGKMRMVEFQKLIGRGVPQKGGQLGNSRVAEAYRKRTFPKRLGKKGMVELQKFIGRGLSKKV